MGSSSRSTHEVYALVRILPLAFSVLGTVAVARLLPVEEFGALSAATSVAQIVTVLSFMGQDQLLFLRKVTADAFVCRSALSALGAFLVALVVAGLIFPTARAAIYLPVLLAASVIQAASALPVAVQAWGRDQLRAAWEAVVRCCYQIGMVTAALVLGGAAATAAGGLILVAVSTTLISLSYLKIRSRQHGVVQPSVSEPFSAGGYFAAESILYSLALVVPLILVAANGSDADNAQVRIVALGYTAIYAIAAALFNEYFRKRLYSAADGVEKARIAGSTWKAALRAIPAAMVVLGCAGGLVPLVLGADYADAGLGLIVLIAGVPFAYCGAIMASLLLADGRVRSVALRHGLAALVAIIAAAVFQLSPIAFAALMVVNDAIGLLVYLGARSLGTQRA